MRYLTAARIPRIALLILLCLAGHPVVYAQEGETVDPVDTVEVVKGFSLTEISSEAERTSLELKKKRALIMDYETARRIRSEVDKFQIQYNDLKVRSDTSHLAVATSNGLRDIRIKWMRLEEKLEGWQNDLSSETEDLELALIELNELKENWELTQQNAIQDSLPEAIMERIQDELKMIDEVRNAASDTISTYIIGMDRIVQTLLDVREHIEQIRLLEEDTWSGILKKDSRAIWENKGTDLDRRAVVDQFGSSYREILDEAQRFIAERNVKVFRQVGLFFLLMLLTTYIFIRSGKLDDEARSQMGAAYKLMRKPFSTAFLISLLTFPWIYKNPPVIIEELFVFLLMIPILLLVPVLLHRSLKLPFFVLVGLFVLDQFQILNAQVLSAQRTLLFAENLIAIGGLLWFFRKGSPQTQVHFGKMGKTAYKFVPILIVLLSISLVANCSGRVTMSRIVTIALTQSAMAGVVLYAGLQVVEGILIFLVRYSPLKDLNIFLRYADRIIERSIKLLNFLALLWWSSIVLEHFTLWEPLREWTIETFTHEWSYGTTSISMWNILQFFIVLSISMIVANLLRVLLEEEILVRMRLGRGAPMSIAFIVKYTIVVCGFFLAVGAAGIDLDRFGLIAGALGVGIGFGLQNLVANFISGIILVFERPIHVGDVVELGQGGLQGTVTEIGVRASKVRTWDGAEVVVPNGDLITKQVTNWTLSDAQRRREVRISTALNADPDQVLEIMRKVASLHPDVLHDPEPAPYFLGYTENTLDFRLLFWVTQNLLQSNSDVALGIYHELREAGIEVPVQRRVVQMSENVAEVEPPSTDDPSE